MRRRVAALALCICGIGRLASAQPAQDLDPRVVTLVGQVSEQRLVALLKKLETFGTRNTLSSVDSPTRGIGAARQWIFDEMKSYSPRLQVRFDTYRIAEQGRITRDVEARNVMAILPGRSPRRIYICGHYDTIAINGGQSGSNAGNRGRDGIVVTQPADPNAPNDSPAAGVNDDGSGTALTMELARVFSQSGLEFDATLVFMCHVAEEQGLMGAKLHAQKARDQGTPHRRRAEQRHRRQRPGRQRHRRRRVDPRVLGGPRGFAVARACAVRAAVGDAVRAVAHRAAARRGPTGSRAAATTRPTTSTGSRRSASANRARTSAGSTTRATRSTACRPRTSRRTRASTPRRRRRSPLRRRRPSC